MMFNASIDFMLEEHKVKISNLESRIAYCVDALSYELENWERKEYETVLSDYEIELTTAKEILTNWN